MADVVQQLSALYLLQSNCHTQHILTYLVTFHKIGDSAKLAQASNLAEQKSKLLSERIKQAQSLPENDLLRTYLTKQ
jgi:hypothetical protein